MKQREATARLTLPLPWISEQSTLVQNLLVERGRAATLTYLDDGITLAVEVLDPTAGLDILVEQSRRSSPGTVGLVAGKVPLDVRADLRREKVSFLDVDGTAEFFWPRLRISASRLTDDDIQRQTPAVTLRGAHARIVQVLLAAWMEGDDIASGAELAARSASSDTTVSRTLRKLAAHGLVTLSPAGRAQRPEVADPLALAEILRDQRGWPSRGTYHGYVYGRHAESRVDEIASHAHDVTDGTEIAFTGTAAASLLGVLTTAESPRLKLWLRCSPSDVPLNLRKLRIEAVASDESNIIVAFDRYRVGTVERRRSGPSGIWTSHPIRVWCDLHSEPRGEDVAAQLWQAIT